MGDQYKNTLHLPKTDFPMKADLVRREPEMLARWESERLYEQILEARSGGPVFILHDGPPFANGDVHMGTALNKTLKDIIVKSRSMAGMRAPFVPGWDCHGLPIEFKVVKESRELAPLAIRKKSEAYARKYIDIQRRQFKRLGVLGDWEHPYLTLDPAYEAEELRAFADLVDMGLVYRSLKPVYWSTGAQTALAEAEVEYADRTDPAIYVEFPLVSGPLAGLASMVIWTTTPWTLPSNVAIAVHPRETYLALSIEIADGSSRCVIVAKALVSKFLEETGVQEYRGHKEALPQKEFTGSELAGWVARHPFLDRDAPVVTAEFVTMETGTGQVHIAPGHGADDFVCGREHGLALLSPVDDSGRFTKDVGIDSLVGKYVFDANIDVLDILRGAGRLLGASDYQHSYPHCWRSKTPVVFRAVEQYFIKLDELRTKALAEIDKVNWLPHWGRNRIYGTVESRPDWCISRQRTWGVPLPVFYAAETSDPILDAKVIRKFAEIVADKGTNIWFELDDAQMAALLDLPPGTTRRHDTLDVWIDSGVSHRAVLACHPALSAPADLYIEATDQHRGWFQSSLMTAIALDGRSPYKTCLTHGFVVDVDGKKISKSSSYEKPMDAEHFVGKYGADILRLWVSSVNFVDEVPFSEEMFTRLADTYRRIRNTLRILLANLHDYDDASHRVPLESIGGIDVWVLHRADELVRTCRAAYDRYEFHKVYHAINQFCAVDLSSLYVDITKDRMYCDAADAQRRRATQTVMHDVFELLCPLLAPILVFTADEAWRCAGHERSVHVETFPTPNDAWQDVELAARIERLLGLRAIVGQAVEAARQQKRIGNALEGHVTLTVADQELATWLRSHLEEAEEFFILSELTILDGPADSAKIEPISHAKCARCWRHRASVGAHAGHPDLCTRCYEVVTASQGNAEA